MNEAPERLDEIEFKVRQVGLLVKKLREENSALKAKNKSLSLQIDKQHLIIENQNKTITDLKTSIDGENTIDPKWAEGLKKEIERYIEDIDKCLAWLRNS
jgi:hypothetical protein